MLTSVPYTDIDTAVIVPAMQVHEPPKPARKRITLLGLSWAGVGACLIVLIVVGAMDATGPVRHPDLLMGAVAAAALAVVLAALAGLREHQARLVRNLEDQLVAQVTLLRQDIGNLARQQLKHWDELPKIIEQFGDECATDASLAALRDVATGTDGRPPASVTRLRPGPN